MSPIVWYFEHSLSLPFFEIEMKTDPFPLLWPLLSFLLSHKKNETLAICKGMNGPGGYYAVWYYLYVESKKKNSTHGYT